MFRNKGEAQAASSSPVDQMLTRVEAFGYGVDDYIWRVRTYLDWAKRCGLRSSAVVDSCIDLAETLTDIPELAARNGTKRAAWESKRTEALRSQRTPRAIAMELDPVYFEAILAGRKTFEGRAYKPNSDKNYPDIRRGDQICFQLSLRQNDFPRQAVQLGLGPDSGMLCTVDDIYFAPTVHGMYQMPEFDGDAFQPMVNGTSEVIQLQRAAVYHTFPGYHDLIGVHGFLGIKVENPQLVPQGQAILGT
jgi:hypothetical protein